MSISVSDILTTHTSGLLISHRQGTASHCQRTVLVLCGNSRALPCFPSLLFFFFLFLNHKNVCVYHLKPTPLCVRGSEKNWGFASTWLSPTTHQLPHPSLQAPFAMVTKGSCLLPVKKEEEEKGEEDKQKGKKGKIAGKKTDSMLFPFQKKKNYFPKRKALVHVH